MLLALSAISKRFPGVVALDQVDLELDGGEVLALMGENGAGKSTLIKILAGAQQPDSGQIRLLGEPRRFAHPLQAREAGISVIYQELNLIPGLTVQENLFLGRESTRRGGWVRRAEETGRAREIAHRLGLDVPLDTPCRRLSIAQQQLVEIGKALVVAARVVIMDEPSASLTQQEVERLFRIIAELKSSGIGILYVSHRLDEVERIADRVAVLRDGRRVRTAPVADFSRSDIIQAMVGRPLDQEFPTASAKLGPVLLRAKNLRRAPAVEDVSLTLRRGEIVGLTGLIGSGRTETARLLFGADPPDFGEITLSGIPFHPRRPREAIDRGVCLLSEDRKDEGLILSQSLRHNFGLPNLRRFSTRGWIDQDAERAAFTRHQHRLRIKTPGPDTLARNLSGGNQQKVVLAKWLEREASVLIFDEPTRGIDVGAKYQIYELMLELAAAGKAILMISSELPEILGMSHRILVMHRGRIVREFADPSTVTQETLMHCAMGEAIPAS